MIVGVDEAKTTHEIAHCIGNMYAYGLQPPFYEAVKEIEHAIEKAIEIDRAAR